ncbi:MAG: tetraacyldisaccharide 4'-kinase [Pseudomonadota bacterium]
MSWNTPKFWYAPNYTVSALSLLPVGWIYGAVTGLRMRLSSTSRALAPVVCIGNPTVGGAGKTPVALAMARLLARHGRHPGFLSRGYGGNANRPTFVRRETSAEICGDEPVLLAREFPTVVSVDRPWGADVLLEGDPEAKGQKGDPVDVIVMDDGFHNASLEKALSFLVIDKSAGLGNGFVFPAGPLRMSLKGNLQRADAVIIAGNKKAELSPDVEAVMARCERRGLPVFRAHVEPDGETLKTLRGKPLIAFAGIARPEKFFATLRAANLDVVESHSFPDHHAFSADDAEKLVAAAIAIEATLITTEKDAVRFARTKVGPLARLRQQTRVLPVTARFPRAEQTVLREMLKALPPRFVVPATPTYDDD